MDEAIDSVKRGQSIGAMYFSKNFSNALQNRLENFNDITEQDLIESEFDIHLDMSGKWHSNLFD